MSECILPSGVVNSLYLIFITIRILFHIKSQTFTFWQFTGFCSQNKKHNRNIFFFSLAMYDYRFRNSPLLFLFKNMNLWICHSIKSFLINKVKKHIQNNFCQIANTFPSIVIKCKPEAWIMSCHHGNRQKVSCENK